MKPLWAMSEPAPDPGGPQLPAFEETHRHSTYGGYGYVGRSRMNKSLVDAIRMAHILADQPCEFSQGGLNGGSVEDSASTHNGLGVADTRTETIGINKAEAFEIIAAGFECGVVGFARGMGGPDRMDPHIHWVGYEMRAQQHSSTEDQIYANRWGFLDGGGGLGGRKSARWWGPPRKPLVTWAESKHNPRNH